MTFLIIVVYILVYALFGFLAMTEAAKQNRSLVSWFLLGFLFGINAFIALKVSNAAEEENHSQTLWSVLGLFLNVFAIIAFETGLNAENRGHDFDCWVILGFCLSIVALFISCFVKPFEATKSVNSLVAPKTTTTAVKLATTQTSATTWKCHKCGSFNHNSKTFCSHCGTMKKAQ
ncbi:MAG: hypothetical protein IJW43_00785 [Clostridia bacterium]|nr:hypothetical protein [Clostridia bacterium]